jgi:hypothetical protein
LRRAETGEQREGKEDRQVELHPAKEGNFPDFEHAADKINLLRDESGNGKDAYLYAAKIIKNGLQDRKRHDG